MQVFKPEDLGIRSVLQFGNVELFHAQHCSADSAWHPRLTRLEQFGQPGRHDLPRHPEPIQQPATLLKARVPTLTEVCPVVVHFVLSLAIDDK